MLSCMRGQRQQPRRALAALAALLTGALSSVGASAAGPPAAAPPLRIDGFGPLKLGMRQSAALATGWLAGRTLGCELAGPRRPIVYSFTGPKAPAGVVGSAEFSTRGRLRVLSFTKGVRTTKDVVVGATTHSRMVARYRAAGFSASARFDSTFQGTFVSVEGGGRQVMGGFGEGRVVAVLGIPAVPVCE